MAEGTEGRVRRGRRLHEDGYDDECIGDDADEVWLSGLSQLDREKVLDERFRKREEILKKKELLRFGDERAAAITRQQDELAKMKEERQKRKGLNVEPDDQVANYDTFKDRRDSDSEYDDDQYDLTGRRPQKRLKTRNNNQPGGEEMQVEELDEPDREIKDTDKDLVHKICLTRPFLVSISSHIKFAEAVKGCLVKVTFKTSTDKMDYKIGEIVDVVEKPLTYKVENKELNKYLLVRVGNETREFRIQYISSKRVEDSELYRYLKELESYGQAIPTIRQLKSQHRKVVEILNSKYTATEIEQIVEKRNQDKLDSTIYLPRKL
jgi:RNA polymerase-associated protein RTF1